MTQTDFSFLFDERKDLIDQVMSDYFQQLELPTEFGVQELKKSMEYSSLQSGKRFRPVLSLMIADAFGVGPHKVLPFACAVEMIHTYSLIHDDLPCMDNDDFRRGEPTNHKVFGETTALLAGDGLLTEAFVLISHAYSASPVIAVELVALLGKAAGIAGMVGGQAIDIKAQGNLPNIEVLNQMHAMKTGALIRVACEGAAVASGLTREKIQTIRDFGAELGLAFQLADDILDSSAGTIEKGSFPDLIGLPETKAYLDQISRRSHDLLTQLGLEKGPLHDLVEYNRLRKK
jgi:geranylgeranyl diphosphate synthase, type II